MRALAYIRDHTNDEQWAKYLEVHERENRVPACPFIEAVKYDATGDTWHEMSPIIGTVPAAEVREMARTARTMRREPWWSEIPTRPHRGHKLFATGGEDHESFCDVQSGEIAVAL